MKLSIRIIFLQLILMTWSSVSLGNIAKTIHQIKVEGNARFDESAILEALKSKEGDLYDPSRISEDIRGVFELLGFSSVDVYTEDFGANSVDVIYVVKEKPFIKKIQFIGAENIEAATLTDVVTTKIYTILDEEKVLKDRDAIEQKYKEKGFFLVNVSYKEVSLGSGESELHFLINEGDKILIGDITFIGNNHFSSSELLAQFMSSTKTRLNSIMSSRSNYHPQLILRDVAFLGYFYKNHGFARVNVSRPVILIDKDKKFARITIKIDEGKEYKVKEITFQGDVGDDLYSAEKLLEATKLKAGEVFKHSSLVADIETISDLYGDRGYAYAYVNPIPTYDDENGLVSLTYNIYKRNKIYVGSVNIVGNTQTRDNVIRRELVNISDGSLYSGTGVTQSKNNIMRLGFFEEVKISKKRSATSEDIMDIKVEVKEKSTGQLRASFGATPAGDGGFGGLYGEGSYEQPNQFGRGFALRGTGRYYNPTNFLLSIDFSNPRVADSLWYLGINTSWSTQMANYGIDYASLKNEVHFNLTVGRKLFEEVSGYVNYGFQQKMLQEDNILVPDLIPKVSTASYLGLRLSRNTLNNLLDPNSGSATSLKHKFVGGPLGGSEKFMESTLNFKYYYPIGLTDEYDLTFKWNNVAARLWNTGQQIALLSRYRLGGPNDLRGYDFDTIGPVSYYKLPDSGEIKKFNKGGYVKFFSQLELIAPLFGNGMVKGVLFTDVGQILAEGDQLGFNQMKYDFGFGFRWKTPIAPLRFEWAYPFDVSTGEVGEPKFIFAAGV